MLGPRPEVMREPEGEPTRDEKNSAEGGARFHWAKRYLIRRSETFEDFRRFQTEAAAE
jgi:hypothetical protein